MNYKESFEILENAVPDAKYDFVLGTVTTNVNDSDLPFESSDGERLVELGWMMDENQNWCKIL